MATPYFINTPIKVRVQDKQPKIKAVVRPLIDGVCEKLPKIELSQLLTHYKLGRL